MRTTTTTIWHKLAVATSSTASLSTRQALALTQRRHLRWVPLAYRGAVRKPSPTDPSTRTSNERAKDGIDHQPRHAGRHHKRHTPRKSPFKTEQVDSIHDSDVDDRQKILQLERRLLGLHRDLIRLAKNYRGMFSSEPLLVVNHYRPGGVTITYQDTQEEKKAFVRAMTRDVRELCHEIHKADRLVEWVQMEKSEDLFRGLCRILQDIIRSSLEIRKSDSPSTSSAREESIALAEAALGTLVKLVSERALVVELTKTWSSTQTQGSSSLWGSAPSPIQALFGVLLNQSPTSTGEADRTKEKIPMAHEDPLVGASPTLFKEVLESIASDVKDKVASLSSDAWFREPQGTADSTIDRSDIETAARRMTALLDVMPSTWLPDIDAMKDILEMQSRAGTLSSARLCYDTFKRHPINQNRLRFSLVLQAYLEAAKYDPDISKRSMAAQEAVAALHREWSDNLPKHRVERIVHSSIVLNCLCVAGTKGEIPDVCDLAERIVKRSLSHVGYGKLQDEVDSKTPSVDPQTIPLVSSLARIYATSGDTKQVQRSRQLLLYMMKSESEGTGRFLSYPLVETFNDVLASLVTEFEGKPRKETNSKAGFSAVEYASTALNYMISRREVGCWPNEQTFLLVFRLLMAVKPRTIGELAEDVLSKLELRRCYSHGQEDDTVEVSLSIYHRVLRCWLEAAKDPNVGDAAERAWKLVQKLEIQSMPFLLSDRETQQLPSLAATSLYSLSLRPTRKTYRLVHQICLETANVSAMTQAADVASCVYQQLQERGMLAPDGSDDRILQQCLDRLPEGDSRKANSSAMAA